MALDIFLKLDGIKGEAQDHKYKDEIDVLSWSWGASQSGTTHGGSGSGAGKVSIQDLSITKYLDKSSPTLFQHCANGKHIKKGTLILRKAGEKPLEYLTIEFEDIIVTHVSMGGSGSEDRLTENVTLNFGTYHMKYAVQTATGSKGAEVEHKWHISKNIAG
ncbi:MULTISPECIES: type VI secretion system tube protein Hcp [Methylobacterium]|uniref:Protein hcp1 n=1 Tax=Methylobacterium jeotgali TaxID=381630 RepID=A0ABQ4SW19_9HYPH|nr:MULTISPECIES: type VI secretion system tube protein Hcp [Methylobacterium]PIU04178.1 MAG: type VI secretion system tube protein Hcp [Methylobacterium sp. CG09_land_8_20_14_0_10_71_15]PIU15065.1 MAG: type VI secretion system tube protein Hcp [Methylobacterium sp. CG08_land_8_20_14_0_20_71_15]GBU17880.1 hypothetical protein AwMethylo_20950 [Methylobacterium sp.]GJE07302.1 Protein hcp1 [Methylobacterium jeotgali]